MVSQLRSEFNNQFSIEKYQSFVRELNNISEDIIPFRIAESPVFVPVGLQKKLTDACESIIAVIKDPEYLKQSERAIPQGLHVPGEAGHSMWLAFDFAVCTDESGEPDPQLIELQGFPSLFFYQHELARQFRMHYKIPDSVSHLFGMNDNAYVEHMKMLLLNGHSSDHVILLEVEPEKQNTRIDFKLTHDYTGIRPVCISKVIREGRKLYYLRDGIKTPIHRIYNRVIFDEFLQRSDLQCEFNLTEDVDVEWAGHPNWFFRISKFTMPFLKNPFVPESMFLHSIKSIPSDLENYVLKPLFSFSGSGVLFHVTKADIENIKDPENWILQRKVNYAPVITSPDGNVKTEIRMLYSWHPNELHPKPVINMARLSRGDMIGVKYNKDKTWVGGSVSFFDNADGL